MPRWRIVIRRDTSYEVDAHTFEEACEAAEHEDYTKVTEQDVDWSRVVTEECFELTDNEDLS